MKKEANHPRIINSISELHRLLGLPKPEHPLISVINFNDVRGFSEESPDNIIINFYSIWIKKDFKGKMKYGQRYYDFDEGMMVFISPGQVIAAVAADVKPHAGWWLVIHPDFLQGYPLAGKIKGYGYFSYDVNEALHLSEKEETMITTVMQSIEQEYRSVIDHFSQDVILSFIEVLLNYSNRFYQRQFITRKNAGSDLLTRLENLLLHYFDDVKLNKSGLPTVQYLSEQLNVSTNYLSDMLRALTGQSTQQHIHNKLMEKAKELISTTNLSISEIAFQLGFEHSQSFSRLFKNKTSLSPLEYRRTFFNLS